MTLRSVRVVVIVICGLGITGMIATQITRHDGASITFGLITAVAILCSMVATAVVRGAPLGPQARAPEAPTEEDAERQASRVEEAIGRLIESGADEMAVRALVRDAVRLGRDLPD